MTEARVLYENEDDKGGEIFMKKKIITILLFLSTIVLPVSNVHANGANHEETQGIVSEEAYIQLYAKNHNITYTEAERIVFQLRDDSIEAFVKRNDSVQLTSSDVSPCTIEYDGMYSKVVGGETVYYHYADVYKEFHFVTYTNAFGYQVEKPEYVRYGALGLVLQDTHSKSFVTNSWETYYGLSSGMFTVVSPIVTVNQETYQRLKIRFQGTIEITEQQAVSLGITIPELITVGFEKISTSYYRMYSTDSFVQTSFTEGF